MPDLQTLTCVLIVVICSSMETSGGISKCCPLDQNFQLINHERVCSPAAAADQVFRFPKHLNGTAMLSSEAVARHKVVVGEPQCPHSSLDVLYLYNKSSRTDFTLVEQGGEIVLKALKHDSLHDLDVAHALTFPARTYCVDSLNGSSDFMARLCPCQVLPCVRKCCSNYEGIDETVGCSSTRHLADNWTEWFPEIQHGQEVSYYRLTNRYAECGEMQHVYWTADKDGGPVNLSHPSTLFVQQDGSLQSGAKEMVFPRDEYCVDYSASQQKVIVTYCFHPDDTQAYLLRMTSVLYIVNATALLVTVALTLLYPDMRKNLHNKMALAHNIMLLIGFSTTGFAQWQAGKLDPHTCVVISYVIQYSMIASFFWLNAMCIDITVVFSGFQQVQANVQPSHKLLYYSLYAWGATSLITSAMALVEYTDILPGLQPRFGESKCFFSNDAAQLLFLYGPMAALLSCNLVLFVYTITKIVRVKRQTAILNSNSTRAANKQILTVFVKLFGLMGVSWISEVISWALDSHGPYWIPLDVLNLSRGLFIFAIFCCTRSVYQLVRDSCARHANRCGARIKMAPDNISMVTNSSRLEMEAVRKASS